MWTRVELAKGDSDTAWFYDLLYMGELLTKLAVLGLVALVEEDRERQRYSLEYALARANSIGDWVKALDELTAGPASALLDIGASAEKRELMQRWTAKDESWQRSAVELLHSASGQNSGSIGDLPSKVALLRWFQDFAQLRNRTRGHGSPTSRACSEMAPELEASLRLISENFTAFHQPWLYLRQNHSNKYRVVGLSGDVSTFDFLKREDHHQFGEGVYRGVEGTLYPVPFLFTDIDLSDVCLANGNYRVDRFEVISYVTDAVRDEITAAYQLPVSVLPLSGTTAGPSLEVLGQSFINLPSRTSDYVKRRELEDTIRRLLTDDRQPIVTLVGRGGAGKTSTALDVAYQLAIDGAFFAIFWFSARDIDLLSDGPRRVQPDVLTENEIAAQFVELMNPAGSASHDFDGDSYFARSLAGDVDEGPFLFVFDNFETVRSAADVYNFIYSHIRLPNKALITSRVRSFRADYPVEVGGMTRDEFGVLAESTATKLGIHSLLTEDSMDELYEESGGHPYVVKVLLGEAANNGRIGSFERVLASRDDILDALFERTYAALPVTAQRVFLTLSSWRSTVPRLAVEAALLRPGNERMDVAKALEVLERSSLIEVLGGPLPADESIFVPLAAGVFGRRKLTVSSMKASVDADGEILRMFGAAKPRESERGLGPRVDRFVSALAAERSSGQDITDGLTTLAFIARQYPLAWLKLADLIDETGLQVVGVRSAADAVGRYLEQNPSDRSGWEKLASIAVGSRDLRVELSALLHLAEMTGSTLDDVSRAANRFNALAATRNTELVGDEKRAIGEKIRALLESRVASADATTLSRLAWLCLNLGDEGAARKFANLGLTMEPANDHCGRLVERLTNR